MSILFLRFEKFPAIISLHRLFTPFFLSSLSGTPLICATLTHLDDVYKSIRLSYFSSFFFLFFIPLWCSNFKWLVFRFTDSSAWSYLCLTPLVIFSVQIFYSSALESLFSFFELVSIFIDILFFSYIIFLISFGYLPLFSFSLLNIFKVVILHSLVIS